jgi:3-oxoacyl-[acyl-carrier protein] reductase
MFQTGEVTSSSNWGSLVTFAEGKYGGLEFIVNNTVVPDRNMPMRDNDETTFESIFDVNVKSLYWTAIHRVPAIRLRGGGAFVNTSTTAASSPPGLVWFGLVEC